MSVRLYVGNLPKEEVERQELQAIFGEASEAVSVKVIKDRKTGKCRGFAFVTVPSDEMADELIAKHNGQEFKEGQLKIEKALPRAKGKNADENGSEGEGTTTPVEAPRKAEALAAATAPADPSAPTEAKESTSTPPTKRRNKKNKRNATVGGSAGGGGSSDTGAVQPDPRWADELAKLKEMLQAANQ